MKLFKRSRAQAYGDGVKDTWVKAIAAVESVRAAIDPPECQPALEEFQRAMAATLKLAATLDELGVLEGVAPPEAEKGQVGDDTSK